jgi:oxygen-independent coproporphyrinogen-3 oxidase
MREGEVLFPLSPIPPFPFYNRKHMSLGIYIHFPFCRSRCSYCDFATGLYETAAATRYVNAVVRELSQADVLVDRTVDTIYLGGGTPSLLEPGQLSQLLSAVRDRFHASPTAEITMEMNPGSAGGSSRSSNTPAELIRTLRDFRELGVTRVSFGAQTFDDRELARLGRSHNAADVRQTFSNLRSAGFDNISFDLIAGLPGQSLDGWKRNLDEALRLRPEHLSFYLLEVHEGTPLADHIRRGMQPRPDDDVAAEMYELMLERATEQGYQHYEISNLCLPGFESRHNQKYWTNKPYLGFGCSAHSYDGERRRWANERDVSSYIGLVESGSSPIVDSLVLSESEIRAEAIFLGLRMMEGIRLGEYDERFGIGLREQYSEQLEEFHAAGLLSVEDDRIRLTRSGALLSNEVFAALLV